MWDTVQRKVNCNTVEQTNIECNTISYVKTACVNFNLKSQFIDEYMRPLQTCIFILSYGEEYNYIFIEMATTRQHTTLTTEK